MPNTFTNSYRLRQLFDEAGQKHGEWYWQHDRLLI